MQTKHRVAHTKHVFPSSVMYMAVYGNVWGW